MARKKRNLIARNKFYIITNGKETEKNYFELLRAQKSIYDVIIQFKNYDPLQLVEYAKTLLRDANQVWCVFDIDEFHKHGKIEGAIIEANNCGVKCAISNISFEIWLLSHYKECKVNLNAKQLKKEISKILNDEKNGTIYSKNDKKMLKQYFVPRCRIAIENAKRNHQKFIKDHNENFCGHPNHPVWNWNPCTTVYMLVEELKLTFNEETT